MLDRDETDPSEISEERYAFGLMNEEAGEIVQEVGKALRFGLHTPAPMMGRYRGTTPHHRLCKELADMEAAITYAKEINFIDDLVAHDRRVAEKLALHRNPDYRKLVLAASDKFRLFLSQGAGSAPGPELPTIYKALEYVGAHKDEGSWAIMQPDGSLYQWEHPSEITVYVNEKEIKITATAISYEHICMIARPDLGERAGQTAMSVIYHRGGDPEKPDGAPHRGQYIIVKDGTRISAMYTGNA